MSRDGGELALVARRITEQLAAGRAETEVIADLIGRGVPEAQARVWVQRMASGMAQGRVAVTAGGGSGEPFLARIGGKAGGLVGLVLVYGVLNGALYVGQDVLARDDVARAEALEGQLTAMGVEIDSLATWLDGMEQENDALLARRSQLATAQETVRRAGIRRPRGTAFDRGFDDYNARVDEWNYVTLPAINHAAARHDSLIDRHNTLVDEYNVVAEKAYTRWWLIPVPAPGGRGTRARPPTRAGNP